jgi:hypothetical protein
MYDNDLNTYTFKFQKTTQRKSRKTGCNNSLVFLPKNPLVDLFENDFFRKLSYGAKLKFLALQQIALIDVCIETKALVYLKDEQKNQITINFGNELGMINKKNQGFCFLFYFYFSHF